MPIIKPYQGIHPKIAEDVFIAENAVIIGDVVIGSGSSVWYSTVIRGDVHYIRIGKGTNVQDGCVLHVTNGEYPLEIGNNVTFGHSVTVHGCTIRDHVLLGIGSIVLDGADIGENSVIAAGSLVLEHTKIPPGVMAAGVPAKVKKELSDEDIRKLRIYPERYLEYAKIYMESEH